MGKGLFNCFFLVFFFPFLAFGNNPFLYPNYNGGPVLIPAGTAVQPLCLDPSLPQCIAQWSQQALPLAVGSGANTSYQYYLPAFLPDEFVSLDFFDESEDWEPWTPHFSVSSFRSSNESPATSSASTESTATPSSRTFYRNTKSDEVGFLGKDNEGKTTAQIGQIVHLPDDSIEVVPESADESVKPQQAETEEATKENTPSPSETDLPDDSIEGVPEPADESVKPQQAETEEATKENIKSSSSDQGFSFRTTENVSAISSTDKQVSGCMSRNSPEEAKTEADFCENCEEEKDSVFSILSSLSERATQLLRALLDKVNSIAEKRIKSKVTITSEEVTEQVVCSPESSLKAIINNFERTCPDPYKNNFKKFFKEAHCKSCKKGIASEVMMAMMSVESAGQCPAIADNEFETSAGLFQINSQVHRCKDSRGTTYRKNSNANRQCLQDPVNNLNKSVDILSDHYEQVNEGPIKISDTSQCPSWANMKEEERDRWRRGVSAYNGGPGWVTRAIESARDPRTLIDTSFLEDTHKDPDSEHRKDDVSWEELRQYYLIEKLSPGNTRGTGRILGLTLSNLAHTEAVLGRNVKGSAPGLVEVWAQYKYLYFKENPESCSQEI